MWKDARRAANESNGESQPEGVRYGIGVDRDAVIGARKNPKTDCT